MHSLERGYLLYLFIYLLICMLNYLFIPLVIYLPTYCFMYLLAYLFIGLCQKFSAPEAK